MRSRALWVHLVVFGAVITDAVLRPLYQTGQSTLDVPLIALLWLAMREAGGLVLTADPSDTTLFTEASEARVVCTTTREAPNNITQWVWQMTANGSKTITNAGVFSASTAGTMFIKGDHAGVAVEATDTITYTGRLTLNPT